MLVKQMNMNVYNHLLNKISQQALPLSLHDSVIVAILHLNLPTHLYYFRNCTFLQPILKFRIATTTPTFGHEKKM